MTNDFPDIYKGFMKLRVDVAMYALPDGDGGTPDIFTLEYLSDLLFPGDYIYYVEGELREEDGTVICSVEPGQEVDDVFTVVHYLSTMER